VVARRGLAQDVVGIACVVEPEEDVPHVESAWVDPSARGQGVLRQMMEILEGGLRTRGIAVLWLWVFDHNHGAWQAYQNLGFRPTGEAQPFYLDRGQRSGERRMTKVLAVLT
jgi:ribosomal protein S18 acetylase RimI-like enzyme